jgi:hypothetical protein
LTKRVDKKFKERLALKRDRLKCATACSMAATILKFSPEAINHGYCFEFATIVFDLVEGSKIAGHNIKGVGHCWVEYKNLCFDAEVPQGVRGWLNLPFWQRLKAEAGAKEFTKELQRMGLCLKK